MVPFSYRSQTGALTSVLRRLFEGLLTAWAAVSVTFVALRLAVGDPLAGLLSRGLATPDQIESLRKALGLDAPLTVQYIRFLIGFLRGDLGTSIYSRRPVSTVIVEQLPATIELALAGLTIAIVLGLVIGILAAWRERRFAGQIATALAGLGTALPVAFTGVLVLLVFRFGFYRFPNARTLPIQRLLFPALVLGFASGGAIARVVHAGLRESLNEPYILAARARGVYGGFHLLWHALKPALPPVISMSALEASFLLSGTVVTETVFSRPGLGRLLVDSILVGDYPIAQGIVAVVAIIYTLSHIIADLLSAAIDPRLRRWS
ncbi:MAG: ABC transporter permease subunit [Anaerolineales bacterium]|nr:ABC transporter permease subunit [Anaerolineales bacterium]